MTEIRAVIRVDCEQFYMISELSEALWWSMVYESHAESTRPV